MLAGRRVLVLGLGRFGGGVGVTRWLVSQDARVTVSDTASRETLAASLEQIANLPVEIRLGPQDERLLAEVDLVVANPAIPPHADILRAVQASGIPLTTEINLFVERVAARCVGVTGTVGKSTICAMTGHMLRHAHPSGRTWLGGNIGRSLLDALPEINVHDLVVLELSSFQLHYTPLVRWSPHIAVFSNITPNHLDWHGGFAGYLADKLNLLRFQDPQRDVIIIEDRAELRRNVDLMFGDVAGVWRYSATEDGLQSVMQSTSAIDCDDQRHTWNDVTLAAPGLHNRWNAAAALTVAAALEVDMDLAVEALGSFPGLPHRLQFVGEARGVRYIDDSKSTTPEAVCTALAALSGPVLLIGGGYDKGVDLTPMVEAIVQRDTFAACIGETGPRLASDITQRGGNAACFDGLEAAVRACEAQTTPGASILLSPGCASWGSYVDFRARGAHFVEIARRAPGFQPAAVDDDASR